MICPKCKEVLYLNNKSYYCKNNHCYDISKTGYVNLLLSKTSCGDEIKPVLSRQSFLNKGYYKPLVNEIEKILHPKNITTVLDCGCGVGYYSQHLSNYFDINGIDISKHAVNEASKHDKKSTYIVCSSIDIPIENEYFDAVYVIFAPLFDESIYRLLKENGMLIVVRPDKRHLYEIKEILYDNPYLNDIDFECPKDFILEDNYSLSYLINVDNTSLNELVNMTPYTYKTSKDALSKLNSITSLDVTVDFNISIYKKRK